MSTTQQELPTNVAHSPTRTDTANVSIQLKQQRTDNC